MATRAILTFLSTLLLCYCFASGESIVYEAEDAVVVDVSVEQDSLASNGSYVAIKDEGYIEWIVSVEQSGLYQVHFGYRSVEEDKAQRLLVNDQQQGFGIGFPYSLSWRETPRVVRLTKGVNTIKLAKNWGFMDVDYLRVPKAPYQAQPEVSPLQNTIYREAPRSLTFLLKANANPLSSITLNGKPIQFQQDTFPFIADAYRVTIDSVSLMVANEGMNDLSFLFGNDTIRVALNYKPTLPEVPLAIVSFNVGHGTSVLVRFPTGKYLLIDTGIELMTKQRVIPFLKTNGITLDHLFITHYHGDHYQGKDLLKESYMHNPENYYDYRSFSTTDTFTFEGTHFTILNSFNDASDENARSLSFRMEYNGFVYIHGGDIYGSGQNRILERYQDSLYYLEAHVFHGNHHFHGSVSRNYLVNTNPYLFLVSAEEHLYARGAYTDHVLSQVYPKLKGGGYRFIEGLVTCEVGHVIIRVRSSNDWSYETHVEFGDERVIY